MFFSLEALLPQDPLENPMATPASSQGGLYSHTAARAYIGVTPKSPLRVAERTEMNITLI